MTPGPLGQQLWEGPQACPGEGTASEPGAAWRLWLLVPPLRFQRCSSAPQPRPRKAGSSPGRVGVEGPLFACPLQLHPCHCPQGETLAELGSACRVQEGRALRGIGDPSVAWRKHSSLWHPSSLGKARPVQRKDRSSGVVLSCGVSVVRRRPTPTSPTAPPKGLTLFSDGI